MKSLNYSSITSMIRRIHEAKRRSDETGIPARELLDRDRELRKKLLAERIEREERRKFLRTAGGLGVGASMLSASPMAFANKGGGNNNQPRVAVVGGGTGGLRAAHRLMQFGIQSTVYEARDRVGGRMYSYRDNRRSGVGRDAPLFDAPWVLEWGGEFISTEHTAIRNLAHQLGLELEDANKLSVGDEETYLIDNTDLYSEHDLLDRWVGDATSSVYETMKRAQQDAPWQPMYNTEHTAAHLLYDNIDAIDWMANYIDLPSSDWVHKLLLADLVAEYGITVGNSALNLIYLLAWNTRSSGGLPLAGTDERLHVVGGNDQIPNLMADQLKAQYGEETIQQGYKLEAIRGKGKNEPFTLVFDNREEVQCDALVMALPFNLISDVDIDKRIWNELMPEKQMGITRAPKYNVSDNGKVMMEFYGKPWDAMQEIGERDIHMAARAYSFFGNAKQNYGGFISTWEGEPGYDAGEYGMFVNYNGGAEARKLRSRELHGPANQADVDRVLAQADMLWPLGENGLPFSSNYAGKAVVSNWIDDPLSRSAFTSPSIGTMTTWWGSQWVTEGNIFFAGEAYDMEYWSYMNGAVLSGERVATEIHQKTWNLA